MTEQRTLSVREWQEKTKAEQDAADRKRFAAAALTGLCANPQLTGWSPRQMADAAAALADAQMRALEAKQ